MKKGQGRVQRFFRFRYFKNAEVCLIIVLVLPKNGNIICIAKFGVTTVCQFTNVWWPHIGRWRLQKWIKKAKHGLTQRLFWSLLHPTMEVLPGPSLLDRHRRHRHLRLLLHLLQDPYHLHLRLSPFKRGALVGPASSRRDHTDVFGGAVFLRRFCRRHRRRFRLFGVLSKSSFDCSWRHLSIKNCFIIIIHGL